MSSPRIVLAAILVIFIYGMMGAMLGALMPGFALTIEQKSNVAFAQAIGLVIASLLAGPIVDRYGKKVALASGLALISLTLYTLPSAAGYTRIVICFLALGLGGGTIATSINALSSDISGKRRGSTLNFLNMFFGLGLMTAPFLAANLLAGSAISLCYLQAGLTTIAAVFLIATPVPPPSSPVAFRPAEALDLLRRPDLWLFSLFLFLYVACEVGVSNWLASYLIAQGIPKTTALNILSGGFAFGLLTGRIAISGVLMKVSPANVTLACPIGMAIATYLMLQTRDPALAAITVFVAGLAMAPVFPTTLAMLADAFPVRTATAMGIAITAGWIGLAVSSPVIGALSGSGPGRLRTALYLFPVASTAMILVNLAIRSLRPRT